MISLVAGEGFTAGLRPAFCSHLAATPRANKETFRRFAAFPGSNPPLALSFEKKQRRESPLGDLEHGCGGRI
jgi:hypothetical protein